MYGLSVSSLSGLLHHTEYDREWGTQLMAHIHEEFGLVDIELFESVPFPHRLLPLASDAVVAIAHRQREEYRL
jgi:hypothetical protein